MSDAPTMTMADGTVINMLTGRPVRRSQAIEIPTHSDAVREVTRVRKRVHELPEPPERMNAVALVALYYLYGLNDMDIAHVTGMTEAQVGNIRMLEAFDEVIHTATQNIASQDGETLRSVIASHAPNAVNTLVAAMDSEDEKVAVVAAKDILDRAGHRPADVVEHRHRVEGGLTIEYVKRDPTLDVPALEVSYKEN